MPASLASCGEEKVTTCPLKRMLPLSGVYTPPISLISVDLPAPFSPIRAWTSPTCTSRSTRSSACTPAKDFDTPWTSKSAINKLILEYFAEYFNQTVGFVHLQQKRYGVTAFGWPDGSPFA